MSNQIHPTAVVSPGAELGTGNLVEPFAVIEHNAILGNDNRVGAHCVIKSGARIGNANRIHEHVVFAGPPQDLGFGDADTIAQMGDGNVLREFVSVNRATTKEAHRTVLGSHNFLMANTHVAHDCRLGDHVVMAPSAALGGHVHVESRAFISGGVMVHQWAHIGEYAMIGGNSKITQDCLPYMITDGVPGQVRGLNVVGLRRAGFDASDLRALKGAFRILFGGAGLLEEQLARLEELDSPRVRHLLNFIRASRRGFHRA